VNEFENDATKDDPGVEITDLEPIEGVSRISRALNSWEERPSLHRPPPRQPQELHAGEPAAQRPVPERRVITGVACPRERRGDRRERAAVFVADR